MVETEKFGKVEISSAADLEDWLCDHHGQAESVWLVTWKKTHPDRFVSTGEILDALVAFGWIDGIRRKLDDDRTMQLISPRKVQHWAKSYKDRAARLIEEGRMQPSGLASIEDGKVSGLWSFMDDVDALIVPDDLADAFAASAPAAANFDASAPSYRRNVLRWIKLAKTPATRAKRIAQAADFAMRDQKIPQM